MSWPSFYGYKYTPIGLRQREMKDYTGTRTMNTTVHLPEGGHLLDIERKYGPDGTHSKKETASSVPSVFDDYARPAPPAPSPRASALPPFEDFPRMSDLERQADDIIANFRARQSAGLDEIDSSISAKVRAADQITSSTEMSSSAAKEVSTSLSSTSSSSDQRMRKLMRKMGAEDF
ncbi:uncharacterized protein LOC143026515 isoform X2 [Oratosquilla oratoria]|uniref:uncharacterized protein LOC143026515 isoform X2 n=1 Tax=Oratosquilla oratoria TaxID=337810 RepID=UPI003F7654EA